MISTTHEVKTIVRIPAVSFNCRLVSSQYDVHTTLSPNFCSLLQLEK